MRHGRRGGGLRGGRGRGAGAAGAHQPGAPHPHVLHLRGHRHLRPLGGLVLGGRRLFLLRDALDNRLRGLCAGPELQRAGATAVRLLRLPPAGARPGCHVLQHPGDTADVEVQEDCCATEADPHGLIAYSGHNRKRNAYSLD